MADPNALPPLPKDHLDHPEQWATGLDPATDKQKGFIAVLEDKNPGLIPSGGLDVATMGKSEASEVIDKLKNGQAVVPPSEDKDDASGKNNSAQNEKADNADGAKAGDEKEDQAEDDSKVGEKRKAPAAAATSTTTSDTKTETQKGKETKNAPAPTGSTADEAIDVDDEESEAGGKDLKKSKQTTLDASFGADGEAKDQDTKADADAQAEDEGDEKEERPSKKTRLDNDPKAADQSEISTNNSTDTSAKDSSTASASAPAPASENTNVTNGSTIPGSDAHLDHPENWSTGDDPATGKQKGFIKVLEKQTGHEGAVGNVDALGKSEASEKIEELKEL